MVDIADVLQNAPRDCWLALNKDETRLVGRGEDMEQAIKEASENGEDDPVLIWSPKAWIPGVYQG